MPSFVTSKLLISIVFYDHDFLLLYFYYSNFPTKSFPQIPGKFLFLDSSLCPISWIFTGSFSFPTWSGHNILVKSITFSFLTIQLMLILKDSLFIFYLSITYLIINSHLYYFFSLSGEVLFPEIFQTLDQWRLHLCLRKDRQTGSLCSSSVAMDFSKLSWCPVYLLPLEKSMQLKMMTSTGNISFFIWDMSRDPLLFINENVPMGQIGKIHMMLELDLRTELTCIFLFPSLFIIYRNGLWELDSLNFVAL